MMTGFLRVEEGRRGQEHRLVVSGPACLEKPLQVERVGNAGDSRWAQVGGMWFGF